MYLATDLSDAEAEADDNERIDVETWPLERLDELIDDATTRIAHRPARAAGQAEVT